MANEDRFLAKWLAGRIDKQTDLLTPNGVRDSGNVSRVSGEQIRLLNLSTEARAVLDAARRLYREFYANICHSPWMEWKIETWDVGYYQIRNAMKTLGGSQFTATEKADAINCVPPVEALHIAHDALRAKLLPQIYSLGFLNPDVEYFT